MVVSRFARAVLAALGWDRKPPALNRMLFYRAEVKAVAADGSTVDVDPEDDGVPAQQRVKLRTPFPGCQLVVKTGTVVLIGWEKGDAERMYAAPIFEGSGGVTKVVINADMVHLGGETGSQFVALANKVNQEFNKVQATLESLVITGSATGEFTVPYTAATVDAQNTKAK